MSTGCWGNIWT